MSAPPTPKLTRALGPWQIFFYALGSMLGAGIYALVGKAAGDLGNAVWLAFLVAMPAALLTGLSYASIGSRYPRAGGAAYVTGRAFVKPLISYVVGLSVLMSGLTSMATGSLAIASNLQAGLGLNLPIKLLAILFVAALALVVYRGIRESMWLNILCTVVETTGLLFIIAISLKFWGGVDYFEVPRHPDAGSALVLLMVLQGAVLTFFSFIGFEDVLNVSEEVKNPRRDVPFGLIGAMIAATLIYMCVAIGAVSVIPWTELHAAKAPLMAVAKKAAPWFTGIEPIFGIVTIFAIGNTALLNYIMGSRLVYGMSTQSLLPRALGRIHPARHTPHVAIAMLLAIVAALIGIGNLKALAEATVLLLLGVFTVVNIALVVLQRRPGEPAAGFDVHPAVPILGALVCLCLLVTRGLKSFTSGNASDHLAPLIALGIVACAIALFFVVRPASTRE